MNNGEQEPRPQEEPESQPPQRIDDITTETQPPGFFVDHAPKIIGGLAATLAVGSVLLVSKSCDSSHENKPSVNPTPATQTKYGLSVKELLDKHPNALQLTNIPRPKIDEMLDNTSALQALRLNTYEVRCYNTPARLVSAFILQGGNSQPQPRYAQFALNQDRSQKLEPFRTDKINNHFSQREILDSDDPDERAVRSYISNNACGDAGAELELTASHELIGSESFGSTDGGDIPLKSVIINGLIAWYAVLGIGAMTKGGFGKFSRGFYKVNFAAIKGSVKFIWRTAKQGMESASEAMKRHSEMTQIDAEKAENEFDRRNTEFEDNYRDKEKPF